MHYLLEKLLDFHHHFTTKNLLLNVNLELDNAAVIFYREIQAETRSRLRGRKKNPEVAQRILKTVLFSTITKIFAKANFSPKVLSLLEQAIRRWNPWQADTQKVCLNLQSTLLELLPSIKKKHQLQKMAMEYRQYLKTEIELDLKKNHPLAISSSMHDQSVWFGAPPVYTRSLARAMSDPRDSTERIIDNPEKYLIAADLPLIAAIHKYQAVNKLLGTLKSPIICAQRQIDNFRHEFELQCPLLEKGRDTPTQKFVKSVVSVLSVGLAVVFGIWQVKGKRTTQLIRRVLEKK